MQQIGLHHLFSPAPPTRGSVRNCRDGVGWSKTGLLISSVQHAGATLCRCATGICCFLGTRNALEESSSLRLPLEWMPVRHWSCRPALLCICACVRVCLCVCVFQTRGGHCHSSSEGVDHYTKPCNHLQSFVIIVRMKGSRPSVWRSFTDNDVLFLTILTHGFN